MSQGRAFLEPRRGILCSYPCSLHTHDATGPQHTSKFDVKLVFGLEDLDIEGAVGGKVLHSPGSKDGLVILGGEVWLVLEGLLLRVGRQHRLGESA